MMIGSFHAWGFVLNQLGFWWVSVATTILPITVCVTPWYEGFAQGDWSTLALVYGGLLGFIVTFFIEDKLEFSLGTNAVPTLCYVR